MAKIKHIAFTVYPVTDMKRARAFYEEDLGLTLSHNYQDVWVEYILDGACLALMNVEKLKAGGRPAHDAGGTLAFEVDDLDEFLKQLKKRGVRILANDIDAPGCRQAYVMDPCGNSVGLHQKKT